MRNAPSRRDGERCEMCAEPVEQSHPHVVDLDSRELMCTCRPCSFLFVPEGAAAGRYRAVPERYQQFPEFALTRAQWEALGVPVGMAFFFRNSRLGRVVAFYPSPAGATESELTVAGWEEVVAVNPGLADAEPDVEAVLVADRNVEGPVGAGEDAFDCFLVPIDACYELVGHLRRQWRGFDGGQEVRERLQRFFDDLRTRSRPVRTGQEAS
ncbi:hypothetical protein EIL87_05965 [Saccharopolyspora rhizosphaerae]|uniref:Uncharacterized protein n=2 Tax=Saccharopolyspora rhizosphaerae TaxID=2492662 RepID=A0A426K092_9PSEU|nr:hypothetical protein EIL87_05965 [Saccharopolyspora rhizosphaerae]